MKDGKMKLITVNIGSPEIIAVIILKFEQGGFSIQRCIRKM